MPLWIHFWLAAERQIAWRVFELSAHPSDLPFCCQPKMYPKRHVDQDDLCCSGETIRNGRLLTKAVDDPAVARDELGMLLEVSISRGKFPTFLPKQLIDF